MKKIITVVVGNRVNFTIKKVSKSSDGSPTHICKMLSGKVISVMEKNRGDVYKIKVGGRDEYYEVSKSNISHVWYVV